FFSKYRGFLQKLQERTALTRESVLGSTTRKIWLKNPVGCLQQPRAAVIRLPLTSFAPRKWIFIQIFLPVAPKPDSRLLCIRTPILGTNGVIICRLVSVVEPRPDNLLKNTLQEKKTFIKKA
ncbi:MAG: hypothetical protein II611_03675, partial [Treponema sp.]|nr:hypothetical protein [Treponema sp.]